MCNYKYKTHELSNSKCIVEKISNRINELKDNSISFLHDSEGLCIFHSKDINWKKELFNDEFNKLFEAISFLNEVHHDGLNFNFAEFQFVYSSNSFDVLNNRKFNGYVDFRNSVFHNTFQCRNTSFETLNLDNAQIQGMFIIQNSNLNKLFLKDSILDNIIFTKVNITEYSFFNNLLCKNFATFEETHFGTTTDFSFSKFLSNSSDYDVRFEEIIFGGEVNFEKTTFESELSFINIVFQNTCSFTNTLFSKKYNTLFDNLSVQKFLIFKSTDSSNKLFNYTVSFLLDENSVDGIIQFENANFLNIFESCRKQLHYLEKIGKVHIGSGCEKYPTISPIFKIETNRVNQRFILDLTNVFCNYFEFNYGQNLGVQVVERTHSYISYFYFSDEKFEVNTFLEIIKSTEYDIWETFANLTDKMAILLSDKQAELRSIVYDLSIIFLKIRDIVLHSNNFDVNDLSLILKSVAPFGNDPANLNNFINVIKSQLSQLLTLNLQINMAGDNSININNTGSIKKIGSIKNTVNYGSMQLKSDETINTVQEKLKEIEERVNSVNVTHSTDISELLVLINEMYEELSTNKSVTTSLFMKIKEKVDFLGSLSETLAIYNNIKTIWDSIKLFFN